MTVKNEAWYQELQELLEPWGQAHLLKFWDGLNVEQKGQLASQIKQFNWRELNDWIQRYVIQNPEHKLPGDLLPADYFPVKAHTSSEKKLYQKAETKAEDLLRQGKVAGFTVAGGQGTRLGYDGPKGTYPIGPVTGKSLFQVFAEIILRAQEKYGKIIPWYIMTSPVNDEPTRSFFEENDFFGLDSANVFFLTQGVLPAIGYDGRVLLAAKDSLALSPDGHGGSLRALALSGALDDMRRRGIEHISYWQIDNPLVKPFDRLFLGLHCLNQAQVSCRSLVKTSPYEKLGNFCVAQGKTFIIEYSDMPDELARAQDMAGRLRFRAGSPAIHIFSRQFIEELTRGGITRLPLHRADKKVPYFDDDGRQVDPSEPNAVKLEMFIFDALPLADNVIILEAEREEQFGPVKNAEGVDSAESCRKMIQERYARWLEKAKVAVPRKNDGTLDCMIEMTPRVFMDEEDVLSKAEKLQGPKRGSEEYYE